MPKFLEGRLKAEYGAHSTVPYKVMNALGVMHGNTETPKGAAMQAKHDKASKPLHPALQKRAGQVKVASQHLGSTVPGFHGLPKAQKMTAIQRHVNRIAK